MSAATIEHKLSTGEIGATARFRDTFAYDILARAPLVMWFVLSGTAMAQHLLADLDAISEFGAVAVLGLLARTAALGFVLCCSGALLLRMRPVARASGLLPRLVAIGGTFSITGLGFFPQSAIPPIVAGVSLALMLIGYGLACYTLIHLGRSLSIMAEARRLVTSGPYAVIRHPLYAAEAVASAGLLLQFLSPAAVILWVFHIMLQCCRMYFEEQVLQQAFPKYSIYAKRVARLIPGVY